MREWMWCMEGREESGSLYDGREEREEAEYGGDKGR